jgi:hypothetical protein
MVRINCIEQHKLSFWKRLKLKWKLRKGFKTFKVPLVNHSWPKLNLQEFETPTIKNK